MILTISLWCSLFIPAAMRQQPTDVVWLNQPRYTQYIYVGTTQLPALPTTSTGQLVHVIPASPLAYKTPVPQPQPDSIRDAYVLRVVPDSAYGSRLAAPMGDFYDR